MTAEIIDGKALSAGLRAKVAEAVAALKAPPHALTPGLAVVLVGDDPASQLYVRNKARRTIDVGMASFEHRLNVETPQSDLLDLIAELNAERNIHGILVQLPLPRQIDEGAIIDAIDPAKDVDGFHVINAGRLATGHSAMAPCTPLGCYMLLKHYLGDLSGLDAVIIGRSNIVGKPMARLLLAADCTVTVTHSRSRNLAAHCHRADILIAAAGRPAMVKAGWVKPGATVIDVGINRRPAPGKGENTYRLVGDVAFDEVVEVAGAITPVPGGVGPMTIACLLANTVIAACRANGIDDPDLSMP
ncbi:MAG: bifunctional methylenetetrahydrofolate dehydrogenase/methenyltetrahydrofolate cyclohydrolase FolD [Hyphomicrobiales bacterium]